MRSAAHIQAMQKSIAALEAAMDKPLSVNALKVFLAVAREAPEAVPVAALAALVGVSEAAVSRNITILAYPARKALLRSVEDPECRRRKQVRLTRLGQQVADQMDRVLREAATGLSESGKAGGSAP